MPLPRRLRLHQMRIGDQRVPSHAGQHPVVDRARLAPQRQHPPQRAGVVLGALWAVPLVDAPIDAVLVIGHPQLGDKAGEADEQGRVQQALPAEEACVRRPRIAHLHN